MTYTVSETPAEVAHGLATSGSRWPLWLLLIVGCLAAGIPFLAPRQSVFFGEATVADHAKAKQKEEVQRRFNEGVMMLHAKQFEHALTAFHRVLQLDPKMPEAHVNMGYALLGMGNPKAAADFFDTATVLRPNQLNAYFGLGEALTQLGDKLGALQAMETYLHRSAKDDPFRRKAEAAVWELRAELATRKEAGAGGPESGVKR
jgi:tetratricopeptide (TPR) repeat protein